MAPREYDVIAQLGEVDKNSDASIQSGNERRMRPRQGGPGEERRGDERAGTGGDGRQAGRQSDTDTTKREITKSRA